MWNTTTLSNRIMNSGENFLLAASLAVSRLSRPIPELACPPAAQIPCPLHQIRDLGAIQIKFDLRKTTVCEKSTLLLPPSLSVALSRIPSKSWNGRALVSVRNSVFAKQVELNRMVKHLLR
jgi:hypothetical protein